tara:strand:+ start:64 stop:324 length:261 start_codon:yes stop_codon:yes gene_type:complete
MMSTESKNNIKVLYLGPSGRPGVYTEDLDQQSKAAREMGAEFVVYDGNSEGELIEALKDTDVAMSQVMEFRHPCSDTWETTGAARV